MVGVGIFVNVIAVCMGVFSMVSIRMSSCVRECMRRGGLGGYGRVWRVCGGWFGLGCGEYGDLLGWIRGIIFCVLSVLVKIGIIV